MTIRVLVVDDSLTVRMLLREVLQHRDFEIVGEAEDGQQAIALCQKLSPDVITMDMMLPVMSGLAATEYIMAHFPTPILIVSSSMNRGALFKTYDALAAGAVDVFEKPSGDAADDGWGSTFLATLRIVSRIRVITHPRARLRREIIGHESPSRENSTPPLLGTLEPRIIALGASTGGPGALVQILNDLPKSFNIPIVIVLHLAAAFADSFIRWLSEQTSRPTAYAIDGERVCSKAGSVIFAPPDYHLRVVAGRFRLSQDAERHSCRPSADVLYESLAADGAARVVACLLTGMGKDGARGLLQLRNAGALTIAQSEESCVVFGMPREAAQLGAARYMMNLSEIAKALATLPGLEGDAT